MYTTFKTDITKVLISTFFINKNSQWRKMCSWKKYLLVQIRLYNLHTFVTWRTKTCKGVNFIFASTPVLTRIRQTFRKVIITMLTTKAWTAKTLVGTLLVLANTIFTYFQLFAVFWIILDFGFAFGAFIYIFTGIPCKKMTSYVMLMLLNERSCIFFLQTTPKKVMALNWFLDHLQKILFKPFFDQVPNKGSFYLLQVSLKPYCKNLGSRVPS